jgi:hypothetical protein
LNVDNIIILVELPFTEFERKRYGIDILLRNGFKVEVFDLSPLIFPRYYQYHTDKIRSGNNASLYSDITYRCFNSAGNACKSIAQIVDGSVAVNILHYGISTFRYYRALSRRKVPYLLSVVDSIPMHSNSKRSVLNRLKRLSMIKAVHFVAGLPFKSKYRKLFGIESARFLLAGGERSVEAYQDSYTYDENTEVIWAHSYDYDNYLINRANLDLQEENVAVFIGAGRDDLALDFDHPLKPDVYFPILNRFLDKVEQETGVRVVVAVHPKSLDTSATYNGREVRYGNILSTISKAKFIITHGSTTIGYAVLLAKPILFISTNDYEAHPIHEDNMVLAASVGKTHINVEARTNIEWPRELTVDPNIYSAYINDYLKKIGSLEKELWQIVSDRLRQPWNDKKI